MSSPSHLLNDTVTYATEASVSNYGDPTFAAQATVAARVEFDSRIVTGSDGTTIEATHVILTLTELPKGTRVWLPGDSTVDTNAAKRVVFVKQASTPGGDYTIYEARV